MRAGPAMLRDAAHPLLGAGLAWLGFQWMPFSVWAAAPLLGWIVLGRAIACARPAPRTGRDDAIDDALWRWPARLAMPAMMLALPIMLLLCLPAGWSAAAVLGAHLFAMALPCAMRAPLARRLGRAPRSACAALLLVAGAGLALAHPGVSGLMLGGFVQMSALAFTPAAAAPAQRGRRWLGGLVLPLAGALAYCGLLSGEPILAIGWLQRGLGLWALALLLAAGLARRPAQPESRSVFTASAAIVSQR